MSKTLRVRTRTGWITKPVEDIDDNRLTAEEIDDTFLGLDDDKLAAKQQAIACADAVTIDWSAGATAHMAFDRATVAFTLSNMINGQVYRLLLIQDATGERTATWVTTVHWESSTEPVLSTGASAKDIITFVKINDVIYGGMSKNFGGA